MRSSGSIVGLEGMNLGEQLLLARLILRKREVIVELRRLDVIQLQTMPGLEIGEAPARVVGAADDQDNEHEHDKEDRPQQPARKPVHAKSLLRGRALYEGARSVRSWGMFVIELVYKADLAKIDAAMADHVRFLKKYYAAGNFLVSGRKIPRDGGIILAVGPSRDAIEAIMKEDPFCARGLADFRIIEFRASQQGQRHPETNRGIAVGLGP